MLKLSGGKSGKHFLTKLKKDGIITPLSGETTNGFLVLKG